MDQSERFIASLNDQSEATVTDLDVRPSRDQLHHDVMMTRSRRQMERGLRLEILVIDRVAVLAQDVSQDP